MIIAVPVVTPLTVPVPEPMVAIEVLPLVHAPPAEISVKAIEAPVHTTDGPVMLAGNELTVATTVAKQPAAVVYVIVTVPVVNPFTIPLAEPTLALNGMLLVHVPPVIASLRVVVAPRHTPGFPVIAGGKGFTVIIAAFKQPVASV